MPMANLQKTIAFVLFFIAIIVVAYLFSDNIAEHCVDAGRCHYYWGNSIVLPDIQFLITSFIQLGTLSTAILILWTWGELSKEQQKQGIFWRRLFRRLFKAVAAFCIIVFVGIMWINTGLWLIRMARVSVTVKIIRSNDRDILNILVLIGLLASALLWYRLYLYRFDTILKRLTEVAECRYGLRRKLPPFSCYNYCLLQF